MKGSDRDFFVGFADEIAVNTFNLKGNDRQKNSTNVVITVQLVLNKHI